MFPTILIVDDEPSIRESLKGILSDEGFEVLTAPNGYEGLKVIEAEMPDLVLLDIWMPGIDGLETLKEIKKDNPFLPVVMITGHGTIETAVDSTKQGAYDFIEKPLSIDKVIVTINNALNFRRLEEENKFLRKKTIEKNSIEGKSSKIQALRHEIMAAAPSDASILITGENGTGKELVARTLHQLSVRADYPLIKLNCATIPEELVESELFGHEKGAFTGATSKSLGSFELAAGGTLFLDEIGEMSVKNQGKLLEVIESKQFRRVGGDRVIQADIRIIVATNKPLPEEIKKGNFREDLYFRLKVVPIKVPKLSERIEDLPLLAKTFLNKNARKYESTEKEITEEALNILSKYSWPGNIREFKNLLERLMIVVDAETITADDIPVHYKENVDNENYLNFKTFDDAKKAFEISFIEKKLIQNGGNVKDTARTMGISVSTLKRKMKANKKSK
ncbi:MAG: sigma-54-dependent Fis family transcriptional regulator [Proteobacteria bacterium]|nr:sigma-54-dependent Fis family transcriptional regulator [Pseudomonadota bacterium]